MIRPGITLLFVCAGATFAVSGIHVITKDRIETVEKAKVERVRRLVLPAAKFKTMPGGVEKAFNEKGEFIGYIAPGSARGYSSVIQLLVGVGTDGTIKSVAITSQQETPGLGTRISGKDFLSGFNSLKAGRLKLGSDVEAISGATISSRAALKAVNRALDKITEVDK